MGRRITNRLTADQVKKKTERGYYHDGGGLYFRISNFDTRSWFFRFTRGGKSRDMGLGPYPDVSLKDARDLAAEARKLLRSDIDPIEHRKATKSVMLAARASALTFEKCAEAFIAAKQLEWKNAKHGDQWRNTLATYAYPVIGQLLVGDVAQAHILKILEPHWKTKNETMSRLRGRLENVLDYATVRGYRKGDNPARWRGHLDMLLATPSRVQNVEHHIALPYKEIGAFVAQLRQQAGMGARALEFAILNASRSGEVRHAVWAEFDLDAATWTIPAPRMKGNREHRIPLSDAALGLLKALPQRAGTELVFPNTKGTALSDMTLLAVLRRMKVAVVPHGFRSTFRDWAGETTAYPKEVMEHALAHQLKDKAEAAYARGSLLDKRRRLMADWATYCGTVASSASVTPINRAAAVA